MVRLPVYPAAQEVADSVTGDGSNVTPTLPHSTKSALSRHQVKILEQCGDESAIADLMRIVGRADRTKFRNQVLKPLLVDGLLKMTIPDKPTSSKQRYRTTDKGKDVLAQTAKGGA